MTEKEIDMNSYEQLTQLNQLLQKHYEDELKHLGVLPATKVIQEAQRIIMEEEKKLDSYRYDTNGNRL